jgi:hypothetical protein
MSKSVTGYTARPKARPRVSYTNLIDVPEPALIEVRNRLGQAVELAFAKAVAFSNDPKTYPLPAGRSLEQAIANMIDMMPRKARREAADRVMPVLTGRAEVRQKAYGPLAALDVRAAAPVLARAFELPWTAPRSNGSLLGKLRSLPLDDDGRPPSDDDNPPGGSPPPDRPVLHRVQFRVVSVECRNDTKGEWFKDEIRLAGVGSNGVGAAVHPKALDLGKYKTGDVKTFAPPEVFTSVDTSDIRLLPRTFETTLMLFEKDWGPTDPSEALINSLVNGGTDALKKPLTDLFKKLIREGGLGSVAGGLAALLASPELPVLLAGAAIGLAVTVILKLVAAAATRILGNEVFGVESATLTLESLTGVIDEDFITDRQTVDFEKFGGRYRLTYDWRLIP